MQDFIVSPAKILDILGFLDKNSKNSLGIHSTILKIMQSLGYGYKFQETKKFLGKKTKMPSPGHLLLEDILSENFGKPDFLCVCLDKSFLDILYFVKL